MTKQQLWKLIEQYRTSGGREEYWRNRDILDHAIDEILAAARETEQAVIAKLATVSVEPVGEVSGNAWDEGILYRDCEPREHLHTAIQLAAARVQENERIANWYYNEGHRLSVFEVAPAIRALITDKDQ